MPKRKQVTLADAQRAEREGDRDAVRGFHRRALQMAELSRSIRRKEEKKKAEPPAEPMRRRVFRNPQVYDIARATKLPIELADIIYNYSVDPEHAALLQRYGARYPEPRVGPWMPAEQMRREDEEDSRRIRGMIEAATQRMKSEEEKKGRGCRRGGLCGKRVGVGGKGRGGRRRKQ